MKKPKFPKQIYVAAEGPWKRGGDAYYSADPNMPGLMGFVDKNGELRVALYELVEVKTLKLEEHK